MAADGGVDFVELGRQLELQELEVIIQYSLVNYC